MFYICNLFQDVAQPGPEFAHPPGGVCKQIRGSSKNIEIRDFVFFGISVPEFNKETRVFEKILRDVAQPG